MNPATEAKAWLRRLDGVQRRRGWLGFPFAVAKKFGEDQAGNLAALIAYYAFFSFFPLLLVLVTVLGFAMAGNPDLEKRVVHSVFQYFPGLGDQIAPSGQAIHGSGAGLAIGVVLALWAGLAVANAAQNGFNAVWQVPVVDRPGFAKRTLRSAGLVAVLGLGIIATTAVSGLSSSAGSLFRGLGLGWGSRILLLAVALVANVLLYTIAFRVLTVRSVSTRDTLPGAVLAAAGWQVLQSVGGWYMTTKLHSAQATYGTFAIVIGLLTWFFLQGQLTLLATELNVVRCRRLWPRALVGAPDTEADRRTLTAYAAMQRLVPGMRIDVRFDEDDKDGEAGVARSGQRVG
jgi:membrane protein